MQTKLSASQVHAVLSEVPSTLLALAKERDEALQKLASVREELNGYRSKERLDKLAAKMEARGFQAGLSHEDKVDFLSKKAQAGQLDAVEQAVDMSVPERTFGWLGEQNGNSADELTSFCLGELVE